MIVFLYLISILKVYICHFLLTERIFHLKSDLLFHILYMCMFDEIFDFFCLMGKNAFLAIFFSIPFYFIAAFALMPFSIVFGIDGGGDIISKVIYLIVFINLMMDDLDINIKHIPSIKKLVKQFKNKIFG